AKAELAHTDLAFTYSTRSKGRQVTHIAFEFKPVGSAGSPRALPSAPVEAWEAAVLAAGVSGKSLPQIREQLQAGTYDLGYVRYVLDTVSAQAKTGKVQKQGGAVFKALTKGYLLEDYQRTQQAPARVQRTANAAREQQRRKVSGELEDARKSLAFIQTADYYNAENRPGAIVEVEAKIAKLAEQLHQLSG
ncbi:replication initiation protein, partial [Hymenobacter crusticola]